MNEKISVIVPIYNVEKYLKQCVDSLLMQTYPKIEIILVDDGSTDGSGGICEKYAAEYNFVRVIHKNNAGLGLARNTGLEHITGKYVTFVDSDDWVNTDLLEVLYNNLISRKVDFCKSGFQRVRNDGTIVSVTQYKNELYKGEEAKKELLPQMIGSSPSQHDSVEMCVCGVLYNADIIRSNMLRFPSERELISEDLVFNIDYMQFADGACMVDLVGYQYRINDNSLTKSYRPDRYKACAYFYSEMERKLKKLKYDNLTMLRLKRMFFIHVRMSIAQERGRVSGLPLHIRIENIRNICFDKVLQMAISEYPIKELQFRQKSFLVAIKKKWALLLYLLSETGLV